MTIANPDKNAVEIPDEHGTTNQKLTAIVVCLQKQNEYLNEHTEYLHTIKNGVNFFVFLTVLGIIITIITSIANS
jgi:uncharacterized membrane protein (DUF106 family)